MVQLIRTQENAEALASFKRGDLEAPLDLNNIDPADVIADDRRADGSLNVAANTPLDLNNINPADVIPDTDPTQPAYSDAPPLTDYLKFKFQKGKAPLVRGAWGREAMYGRMGVDEALEKGNQAHLEQVEKAGKLEDTKFKDAPVTTMLGEAAEMLPFMMESISEGLKDGMMFGGAWASMAAVAGQIGPQIATPEELITVPSAFAAGMTKGMAFGIIKTSLDVEGGNLFLDFVEKGISEKTARPLSLGAGLAIGIIEATEMMLFAAPFKKAFRKTLKSKVAKSALLKMVKQYFKTLAIQTGQEELQEIVKIATEILAGSIEDNPNVIPTEEDIRKRLVDTAVKSAQGLAVLGAPGAVTTGISTKAEINAERRLEVIKEAFGKKDEDIEDGKKEKEAKGGEATKSDKVAEGDKESKAKLGSTLEDDGVEIIDRVPFTVESILEKEFEEGIGMKVDSGLSFKASEKNKKTGVIIHADEDGNINGVMKVLLDPNNDIVEISPAVLESAQGQGIGTKMLEFAEEKVGLDLEFATSFENNAFTKSGLALVQKYNKQKEAKRQEQGDFQTEEDEGVLLESEITQIFKELESENLNDDEITQITKLLKEGNFGQLTPEYLAENFVKPELEKIRSGEVEKETFGFREQKESPPLTPEEEAKRAFVKDISSEIEGDAASISIADLAKMTEKINKVVKDGIISEEEGTGLLNLVLDKREAEESISAKDIRDFFGLENVVRDVAVEEKIAEGKEIDQETGEAKEETPVDVDEAADAEQAAFEVKSKEFFETLSGAEGLTSLTEFMKSMPEKLKEAANFIAGIEEGLPVIEDALLANQVPGFRLVYVNNKTGLVIQTTQQVTNKEVEALGLTKAIQETATNKITSLEEAARVISAELKNKFKTQREAAEQKARVDSTLEQGVIDGKVLVEEGPGERGTDFFNKVRSLIDRAVNKSKHKFIAITPMNVVFDLMSTAERGKGFIMKLIKRPMDKAYNSYKQQLQNVLAPIEKLKKDLKLTDENMERILKIVTLQQRGGRTKLETIFSPEHLDAVEAAGLNDEESIFLKEMQIQFDIIKPEIKEVLEKVYGQKFEGLENFFPMLTDFEAMENSEIQEMFGPNTITVTEIVEPKGSGRAPGLSTKPFQQRKGGANKIKLDALEVFRKYMDRAVYMVNMGQMIEDARVMAGKERFKTIVGEFGQEVMNDWIKLMARNGAVDSKRIKSLDWLRNNTGIAILGYKLSTIIIQPTALIDSMALIGHKAAFQGAYDVATNPEWRKFIRENFPEIRDRMGGDLTMRDIMNNKSDFPVLQKAKEGAMWGIQTVDGITAAAGAAGAYRKFVEEKGGTVDFANPDVDAILDAQEVVSRSQGSGLAKDAPGAVAQARFFGNISVDKAFFQFQTFALGKFSLITSALSQQNKVLQIPTQHSLNVFTYLTLAAMTTTAFRVGLDELLSMFDEDDDEKIMDKYISKLVREVLTTIPISSNILSGMFYEKSSIPAVDMVVQSARRLGFAAEAKSTDTRVKQATKAVISIAGITGVLPGSFTVDKIVSKIFFEDGKKSKTKRFK